MIDLTDFKREVHDLVRGETVRVNHTECPAGQDTRRRLYITRPAASPHVVLGWCHNCQDKGVLRTDAASPAYRQFDDEVATEIVLPTGDEFAPPPNLIEDHNLWPVEAVAWRIQKRMTEQDCESICVAYDPATHRMYLPMWDRIPHAMNNATSPPVLEGYQLRRLTDSGPKYLTAVRDRDHHPSTVIDPQPLHGKVQAVLVEDLASGMALSNALESTGRCAYVIVNYGTKVTPEVLYRVTDFEQGLVWLDNDSDHVTTQAHKIAKVWRMLSGAKVSVEDGMHDPKALDYNEMTTVVDRHWNGQH